MSKEVRPRLSGAKLVNYEFFNNDETRVLVIGDLHSPFDLDSYFDHVCEVYERYNCNRVVFIGDVIDNHYSSYHETDANGMGGGDELAAAKRRLARYYHRFPNAVVLWGNHDRNIMRKAQTGGVPKEWIKDICEVLEVPTWEFHYDYEIDGVRYTHGDASGKARTAALRDMQSTVTGHYHTDFYTQYYVGANNRVFGMAVGCGIDKDAYAMGYSKGGKKPAIGCGVVIGGHTAIAVPMLMEKY